MRLCTKVEKVEQCGDWFRVRTDSLEIRIFFLTDFIVRIRAGFDGNFEEESYSLVMTAWEDRLDGLFGKERRRVHPAPASLADGKEKAVIRGNALCVEVEKDPFRICVYDAGRTRLHADIADIGYMEDCNRRRIHTSEISPDDCFYGFGEKGGELDKRRKLVSMNPRDALGYDPKETDPLYKHIPFYIKLNRSTRKAVGYFYHNTYACDFDLGRERSNYWKPHSRYRADGGDIDLFLIAGPSVREVVERYTDLTGKSALLPKYALGYLGSSMYYPELAQDCDDAITGFVDTAKEEEIPTDGFQLSSGYTSQETPDGPKRYVFTWNRKKFKDPKDFFTRMHARGITVSPNVKPAFLLSHPYLEKLKQEDVFVKDSREDRPGVGAWWGGKGVFWDFTNPRARALWKELLGRHVLGMGTCSVWNDNCEYDGMVDQDCRCDFEGKGGTIGQLKSVMPNLMCRATRQAIEEESGTERPFVVCRSGYSGIQRYAQTWAGDNLTCWESLKYNIATILGMSLSGVANQGCDVCGFYGPAPEAELMVRWVQNGIFQPRFSVHSVNTDNTVTELWMYGEKYTKYIRDAIRFRYRLFPYLYSLMERAHESGLPILEPMCSAFQQDPACYDDGVDFMVGDSLLVANVVEKGAQTRKVYLPKGADFYDFWSREKYEGGKTIELPVTLQSIPLMIRSGGIVPLALNQMDNLATQTVTGIRLICAPDRDGSFVLYEDDGLTTEYRDGNYRKTRIAVRAGERTLLEFHRSGPYKTSVERVLLDVIHREKAPYRVLLSGRELPHFLYRNKFDKADEGWYYSQTLKSVQVKYRNPGADYRVVVSFEPFDMLGM